MKLEMELLEERLAVAKLPFGSPIPDWVWNSKIFSIAKTEDELTVIAEETLIPYDMTCENDWRLFRIKGEYPISLVGLVSHISSILAKGGVCIFPLSTYGTDHYLVKEADVAKAVIAFNGAHIDVDE